MTDVGITPRLWRDERRLSEAKSWTDQRSGADKTRAGEAKTESKKRKLCPAAGQEVLGNEAEHEEASEGGVVLQREGTEKGVVAKEAQVGGATDEVEKLTGFLEDWHIQHPDSLKPAHAERGCARRGSPKGATDYTTQNRTTQQTAVLSPAKCRSEILPPGNTVTGGESEFEVVKNLGKDKTARNGATTGGKWCPRFPWA